MAFARRMNEIEPFRVVEVLTRARQLEAQGRDILHLEAGEPDFKTAEPICEAGIRAIQQGHTHYTPAAGMMSLREAISEYYRTDYGLDISPSRIMVTAGASGALLLIAALLMEPGRGMLMADPGYPCNRHFLRLVEGEAQLVPVGAEHRYQLNASHLADYWCDNTIGAMVASPANPTGEVLRTDELEALQSGVAARGGYLVVDEIYHGLDYEEKAASILATTDDAFVINSFSKYFGMTGWRLGWLVAPENAVQEMEKLAQNLFISLSTPAQYAALSCFKTQTREILDRRKKVFQQRRDFLYPELCNLGFEIASKPAGGLYLYADISRFSDDSQQFCTTMLEQHGIAMTPGEDFGRHRAAQHVRFSYTTEINSLEKAVQRLNKVLT
ncbi:aspartate/methionine/tyrosine aminotransferase [Sinobacterium caligoides]|uniref:Aminotransferase n=1 Tax=Sinobacterium caligoides TaxID=933926 RepID=A0A3N2DFR5_9GAMM|nr:pyridoxal phosphate-dependent aminotransferase [Sinobacterium caligoides]ROR98627.1 aspartate/methionine/tyrosine aminotransferase [Sinobacterium caligoides]